ncbi:MAG: hypothetical protein N2489_04625 [Clostridia bacterium]|nr:hypothetical protein [Clostridia bacterium]
MRVIIRRPLYFAVFAIIMLLVSIFEYNILLPLLFGFSAIGTGSLLEAFLSFNQFFFNLAASMGTFNTGIIKILISAAAAAAGMAALLSGLFQLAGNALENKEKQKGEFQAGIKKHFFTIFLLNLIFIPVYSLYMVFIMVACIPAAAISRIALSSRPEFMAAALLIDLVTLGVVFFTFMFLRLYTLFCYPAAVSSVKKVFTSGKTFVDNHFWVVTGRMIVFDAVFFAVQGGFIAAKLAAMHREEINIFYLSGLLLADWAFKTFFFACFASFVFSTYKERGHSR